MSASRRTIGRFHLHHRPALGCATGLGLLFLAAAAGRVSAQTPQCQELSEQLLKRLDEETATAASTEGTRSMEEMVETQRRILREKGCDPRRTGYDLGVEGIRLNQRLESRPRKTQPFRLDQLLRIEY